MITAEEVRRWLASFDPGDNERARRSRDAVLALVEATPSPGSRSHFAPGHLTASGLVLSDDHESVLLVFHARLRRWLQPGGHLEPWDASLIDAARREVLEETGVALGDSEPLLVGVDVHHIPAARGEPAHRHHDLMFRFVIPRRPATAGPGALRVAWCPVRALENYAIDEPLRLAVARARAIRG